MVPVELVDIAEGKGKFCIDVYACDSEKSDDLSQQHYSEITRSLNIKYLRYLK